MEGPPPLDVPRNVICITFLVMVQSIALIKSVRHVQDMLDRVSIKGKYVSTVELGLRWSGAAGSSFQSSSWLFQLFVSVSNILLQLLLSLLLKFEIFQVVLYLLTALQ